jgi:paraquat-inducible protein B
MARVGNMKTKVSPAVVGAFVIGAFALGTLALLSFGGFHFFEKPERFVVYFDESISGLDQGSAVKLRGVRVGRVTGLNIRYDGTKNRSVVAVTCELNRDMVTDPSGVTIDVSSRAELEKLVQRGLRAQLGVAGLATGLLFVELDFKDPQEYPAPPPAAGERYVVVPQIPSTIAEFQAAIGDVLGKVKTIDFAGLARDISTLAQTARKQIDGVDLKGVAEQWKKTGAQFEALASGADVKKTFENLNGAIADLRATITKLDAQIAPTSREVAETMAEARKTLQAFNATAATAQSFIAAQSGIGPELARTLTHLNEAADSVTRLVDFLERNPNALITGRKRPQ